MKYPKEWEIKAFEAILNRERIELVPCVYDDIETQCIAYVTKRGATYVLAVLLQPEMQKKLRIARLK